MWGDSKLKSLACAALRLVNPSLWSLVFEFSGEVKVGAGHLSALPYLRTVILANFTSGKLHFRSITIWE